MHQREIPAVRQAAHELGELLAAEGWRLIYGAGDVGMMGEVARAAQAGGAETFGVIPVHLMAREVGKRDLSQFVVTENMHERKKVMFMNSDAIVVLPGGAGSLDVFFEVLTWRFLGLHDKPIALLNTDGYWDKLSDALQAMAEGVIPGMPNLEDPDPKLAGHAALAYPDRPIVAGPGKLKAALVTSLGFGHVGAAVLVAHPDVLLAGLPADVRQAYAARRAAREAWRVQAEQAVRLGERPACAVRLPDDRDVNALLLEEGAAC